MVVWFNWLGFVISRTVNLLGMYICIVFVL